MIPSNAIINVGKWHHDIVVNNIGKSDIYFWLNLFIYTAKSKLFYDYKIF